MEEVLPLRPPAGFFILSVLQTRKLSDEAKRKHLAFPAIKRQAECLIEKEWTAPDGDYIIAGAKKEILADAMQGFNAFDKALGREKKSAQKRKFVELWSDHFREHCGNPADKIVSAITEIAFGGEFDVTDVRNALKFRRRRGGGTPKG